ncbi:MAG TPA: HEAT repeat domain-containing protein [Anaerolineae bacterium]|nr:HEAT repeat domain-containing protein [Anaerolineae bacterium]
MLMGILASFLWYQAEKSCVAPYYEYKRLGPVSLASAVQNVQVQVEYPRRISRDDRRVQHGKRIIVSVAKTEAGPAEPIHLAVKPVSGHLRFLTEDGHDTNGQLVITATYGITNLGSLYLEHPNVSPGGTISSAVQVLPPTGAITQPLSVQGLSFAIEEESFIARTTRRVVSFIPWQTFLLTLLALPGALLKGPWDRNKRIADLHGKIKQAWEAWHIDDIRALYNEYQRVRLRIPLLFGRALDILGHKEFELLYRRSEARFHFEQAREVLQRGATREAKEHLARALDWDPTYEKVRLLDERALKLEEEYRKTKGRTVWWIEPMPELKARQMLIALLEDREGTQAEVRRRIVNVSGHIKAFEARRAVEKALREDNDLAVRAQAAWILARWLRPEQPELKSARPEVVKGWLKAFLSPLEYNPFEAITAEADAFLDRHFFNHPVYRQLLDYASQSIALFANPGGGKTSCRRMFKYSLESPPHLVVEYTNFSAPVREAGKISVEDHVRGIVRQASDLLGIKPASLSSPGGTWREQISRLLENARKEGYTAVHVLVDNVDGYAETQANLKIAELLIRHLVGNFDLLDTANLYFKFFLPASLKKPLLKYGGFATGRIRTVDMEWTGDLFRQVLQARLKAASPPRSPVDSLMAFTGGHQPMNLGDLLERARGSPASPLGWPAMVNLDSLLVEQAQGSPRRLITLVNVLFQHRAQIWHQSGKSPEELYITVADWATLLEHLLRRGDVI